MYPWYTCILGIMPRASRKKLNKEISKELRENFSSLISDLQHSNDIEKFLEDFLTKEENLMLSKRLMLYILLENKYRGIDIQSILGVSEETVRVHKNNYEKGGETYKKIINKIANRKRIKLFLQELNKKFKPIDLFLQSKTNMKARAKFLSGDY